MFSPTLGLRLVLSFLFSTLLVLTICAGTAHAQSFSTPTNYSTGENPNSGVAGDFNGDAKLDLAAANVLNKSVTVRLNNGDGTFGGSVDYTVDFNPETIAMGDFNGDGKLDLVTGNFLGGATSAGTVSILIGNGNGTFQTAVHFAAGTPAHVAVADLNADSKLDLVTASGNTNKASVLLGNGNGTFQAAVPYTVGTLPRAVAIADYNGDTKPDLAVTNMGGTNISILIGNGDGTFQAAVNHELGTRPMEIVARDLNGDGKQDLIFAAVDIDSIGVLLGNGDASFQPHVPYATLGDEPQNLALADFNGDGKVDVVVVNANIPSSFSVLRGVGNGTFLAADNKPSRNSSWAPIVGDFDADGKPDLGIANNAFDLVDVFLNSPSARPVNITVTQGIAATVQVATFIDYDNTKTAGSFTASINWGDGTAPTAGTIAANGSGGFNVTGTHTYANAGNFNVDVQVADSNNNFAQTRSTATVKATTATAVISSVNPSDFGQTVTFTATVTSSAGTPSGSVQFKDNGTNLGTAMTLTGGAASVTTSTLTVGTHTITAEYSGSTSFAASNGTLAGGQVVRPIPTLSINDVSTAEGDSGTKTLSFTVTLSAASNLTVNVNFATADASASAGSDYQAGNGTLTLNPGETTKTVAITINGDTTNEENETFVVNLSTPVNATISDSQGVGTIVNDDAPMLLVDETTGRALALDSMITMRDPFSTFEPNYFSTDDKRRRVALFVWRLGLLPTDTAANLTVTAHDGAAGVYVLNVEHMSAFTQVDGVTVIVVRLPETVVGAPRDLFFKVQLRGPASNEAVIKIAAP